MAHLIDGFGLDPGTGGGLALIALAEIVEVPEWQPRDGTSEATIRKYANAYESGAEIPPLLVARVVREGQEQLALLDGWHRLAALRSLGRAYAECRVLPGVLAEQDAAWRAAEANLRHGLPLKAREVRKAFRAYVRAGQHRHTGRGGRQHQAFKSYREMAAELGGVPHSSVRNWMLGDFPGVARAMSGDGAAVGGGGAGSMTWIGATAGSAGLPDAPSRGETLAAIQVVEALEKAGDALRVVQAPEVKRRIAREVFALAAALEAEGYEVGVVEALPSADRLEEAPDF